MTAVRRRARSRCRRNAAALLIAILIGGAAAAQVTNLPDMGSPSDRVLSVRLEAQIGRQIYYNLLETGSVMTDPELQEYIQNVGMRLVAQAEAKDGQRFRFFLVDSPIVNAFALPGGYIGVHTGLLLETQNESELAGVLAHEISHVTQRHISRAVFANQRASTLSMAAMLGALLVGVATGADAGMIQGAVGAAQSFAIEQQISFTRSNEMEADRVAIPVLANAGFDPTAMADFFETMGRRTGSLQGGAPEFLLTHPVSADRMADARIRAKDFPAVEAADSPEYALARARARLLTSRRPEAVRDFYAGSADGTNPSAVLEQRYGMALAMLRTGRFEDARDRFAQLVGEREDVIPLHSGLAESLVQLGRRDEALAVFERANELFPRNVPLTVRYAETLLRFGQPDRAHMLLLDLLNQVPPTLEQVRLIAVAANAAGDVADAHYYMAEYHAMSGSLRLAIDQLLLALGTPGLDSVQRARFRARLDEFQSYLPEPERDQNRRTDDTKAN